MREWFEIILISILFWAVMFGAYFLGGELLGLR